MSSSSFSDQLGVVVTWFSAWSDCEKVVALYCLLRKLPLVQTRFLAQVLNQILASQSIPDDLEQQANDPAFIRSLQCTSSDCDLGNSVRALLQRLPLLRTGNNQAKAVYLQVLPTVLRRATETGRQLAECQQILSYALIHPAISAEELTSLSGWQTRLLDETAAAAAVTQQQQHVAQQLLSANTTNIHSPDRTARLNANFHNGHRGLEKVWSLPFEPRSSPSNSSPSNSSGPSVRPAGVVMATNVAVDVVDVNQHQSSQSLQPPHTKQVISGHPKLMRSSTASIVKTTGTTGLVPGSTELNLAGTGLNAGASQDWVRSNVKFIGAERETGSRLTVQPPDYASSHLPLSPQSSDASSGSGGADDTSTNAGMQEVSVWLKSLRLHKYCGLFQQMQYDEMMNLTDEWLEAQGVTKGARNKILISVKKLADRPNSLRIMEKEIMSSGNVWSAISELRQILNTPIKACDSNALTYTDPAMTLADSRLNPCLTSDLQQDAECTLERLRADSPSQQRPESDQDLPGLITRVLGKLCTQLLVTMKPENDCLTNYLHLLDRCLNHQAFTDDQKKKMLSWRQQIQRVWQFQQQRHHRTAASTTSLPPQGRGLLIQRPPGQRPDRKSVV